jgi:hypothetical protein
VPHDTADGVIGQIGAKLDELPALVAGEVFSAANAAIKMMIVPQQPRGIRAVEHKQMTKDPQVDTLGAGWRDATDQLGRDGAVAARYTPPKCNQQVVESRTRIGIDL